MSYERERNEQYNDIPFETVDNMLFITSDPVKKSV